MRVIKRRLALVLLLPPLSVLLANVGFFVHAQLERAWVEQAEIEIVVARANIKGGEAICDPDTLFARKRVRLSKTDSDTVISFQGLSGKIILHQLREGEPVTWQQVSDWEEMGILRDSQAVGLRIEKRALPCIPERLIGNRVDLWQRSNDGQVTCLFKNVRVLCGSCVVPDPVWTTVTLELHKDDVLALATARLQGPIFLTVVP